MKQTKNQIQVFSNTEFGEIRTVQIDGEPWFVGKDLTATLGYSNSSKALKDHVDTEDKLNNESLSSLGQRGGWLVNESGLYSLILSSKLPAAKKFKRWVTSEILPAIKRDGCYVTDELRERLAVSEEEREHFFKDLIRERSAKKSLEKKHRALKADLAGVLLENAELKDDCEFLEAEIDELIPSAAYCDTILMCADAIPVTVIASSYGLTAVAFNRLLHELKIIRKVGGTWVLYAKHNGNGYTVFRTYQIGENKSARHLYWTEKGRRFLYDMLGFYGLLPEVERR